MATGSRSLGSNDLFTIVATDWIFEPTPLVVNDRPDETLNGSPSTTRTDSSNLLLDVAQLLQPETIPSQESPSSTIRHEAAPPAGTPVQWAPAQGGNGHYYEAIAAPGTITWQEAASIAAGKGGYLATITSEAENSFVFNLINSDQYWLHGEPTSGNSIGPWIGGHQAASAAEPGGGWSWTNGEGAFGYANWDTGEPNNALPELGNEDAIIFFAFGNSRAEFWNDFPDDGRTLGGVYYTPIGYIIEYDEFPGNPPVEPTVSISGASVSEGNVGTTSLEFTISLSASTTETVTVKATAAGGTAKAGTDYVANNQTITVPAGQTTTTFSVTVLGDTRDEANETVIVTLSQPQHAVLANNPSATGTIIDDDEPPTLSISPASVIHNEGNGGATAYVYTVSRTGDTSGESSASWSVAGSSSSPANATDFQGDVLPGGTVNFAADETSQQITINVAGDAAVEPDEGFSVTLSSPSGATLGTANAGGIIINDDASGAPAPVLSIAPAAVIHNEGNSGTTAFVYTITRTGDTSGASSVSWSVAGGGGSPANAADFQGGVLPGGTVNFAAGETSNPIAINVAGDTTVEPNEGFTVTLSSPTGATLGTASAAGTITNDDAGGSPPPVLSISPASIVHDEGDSGTTAFVYTVTRTGDLSGASSATWSVPPPVLAAVVGIEESFADPGDFPGGIWPTGPVSFLAGESSQPITVYVAGDTDVEGNEPFTVILSSPTGATLGTASATGTITNDDSPGPIPPTGTPDDDVLTGTAEADSIDGLAGNDLLDGGGGNDTLGGGDGADTIFGGDGGDSIAGGAGDDLIASDLGLTAGNDSVDGGAGDDIVWAGGGDDTVDGADGNDILVGEGGNDSLLGSGGDDVLYGGDGADTLLGGDGNDIFAGDLLGTAPGNDSIDGGAGDDVFFGLEGDDTLVGGPGTDMFLGGPGADVFVYASGFGPFDAIWDFDRAGGDRIQLAAGINATAIATPQQAAAAALSDGTNSFVVLGDDMIIVVGVAQLLPADFVIV